MKTSIRDTASAVIVFALIIGGIVLSYRLHWGLGVAMTLCGISAVRHYVKEASR